jgi:hypothetical protein
MFAQDLRDVIMVALMFVLRVGAPIALILVFGRWLERKLAPPGALDKHTSETEPRSGANGKIIRPDRWHASRRGIRL